MPRSTLTARQLNARVYDIWKTATVDPINDAAISMYSHAQALGISVGELASIMSARGVPVSPQTAQQVFGLAGQWEAAEGSTGDSPEAYESYQETNPAQGMAEGTEYSDSSDSGGSSSGDGQGGPSLGGGSSSGSSAGSSSGAGGGTGM